MTQPLFLDPSWPEILQVGRSMSHGGRPGLLSLPVTVGMAAAQALRGLFTTLLGQSVTGGHPASSGDEIPEPKASPVSCHPTHAPVTRLMLASGPRFSSEVPSCLTEIISGEWPGNLRGPESPRPAGALSTWNEGWARGAEPPPHNRPSCFRLAGLSGNPKLSSSCLPLPGL